MLPGLDALSCLIPLILTIRQEPELVLQLEPGLDLEQVLDLILALKMAWSYH